MILVTAAVAGLEQHNFVDSHHSRLLDALVMRRAPAEAFGEVVSSSGDAWADDDARGLVLRLDGRSGRVRARIGSVIGHASTLEADVSDGTVTLRGPVLHDEVERLLRRVKSVRGVGEVVSELEVHDTPGNVPALQGRPRPMRAGEVFEPW